MRRYFLKIPPENLHEDSRLHAMRVNEETGRRAIPRLMGEAALLNNLPTGTVTFLFSGPQANYTRRSASGGGVIFHFGPEQAFHRYLSDRTDGLRLPDYFRMIKARVG
jgi:hypothetical protein